MNIATSRIEPTQFRDPGTQPAYSALRSCAWFASWTPSALAALSSVSSLRSFGSGQPVTLERQGLGAVMVVIKGRLRAIHRGEGGREVTLETFRAGEVCVDGLTDTVNAFSSEWIASETSLLLFIPRADFLSHLRTMPDAAFTMVKDFERRLMRSKAMVAGLALSDVQARLHHTLVILARDEGEPGSSADGIEGVVVRRSPTQQELGNMIGACRETVSRIVAELARQGLVALRGRRLTISHRLLAMSSTVTGEA